MFFARASIFSPKNAISKIIPKKKNAKKNSFLVFSFLVIPPFAPD